jgi:hypothetical protein
VVMPVELDVVADDDGGFHVPGALLKGLSAPGAQLRVRVESAARRDPMDSAEPEPRDLDTLSRQMARDPDVAQ